MDCSNCPSSITFHVSPLLEWVWLTDGNGSICCFLLCFGISFGFGQKQAMWSQYFGSDHFVLRETKLVKGALCDNLYESLFLWLCIISTWCEIWDLLHVSRLPIQAWEWWVELFWCCWTLDFFVKDSGSPKGCDFFSVPLSAHLTGSTSG